MVIENKYERLSRLYLSYKETGDPDTFAEIAELVPELTSRITSSYLGSNLTIKKDIIDGDVSHNFLMAVKDKKITHAKASTYLYSAINNAIAGYKRTKRHNFTASMPEQYWQELAVSQKVNTSVTRDLKAEVEAAVDEAIENPIDKDIFKRHYLEKEPLKKLAQEYDMSESATKMRMARIRAKLAELPAVKELYEISNLNTRGGQSSP